MTRHVAGRERVTVLDQHRREVGPTEAAGFVADLLEREIDSHLAKLMDDALGPLVSGIGEDPGEAPDRGMIDVEAVPEQVKRAGTRVGAGDFDAGEEVDAMGPG